MTELERNEAALGENPPLLAAFIGLSQVACRCPSSEKEPALEGSACGICASIQSKSETEVWSHTGRIQMPL